MKKKSFLFRCFVLSVLVTITVCNVKAQQQFIQTADKKNSYCNSTCTLLNIPDLNKNPAAVVFATPVIEGGVNLNPHPIGVHFIVDKWSIFNLDQAAMPTASKFNVQYFVKPDPNYQFVHVITKENLQDNNTRSFINNPTLNNNPEATFQFIVNGLGNNRDEVNVQFDKNAGQWYIYNVNKKTFDYNVAYNIIIASGTKQLTKPPAVAITPVTAPQQPVYFGGVTTIFMSAEGKLQGKFKGEVLRAGQPNKVELTNFTFEVTTPFDLVTGASSAKRNRLPITVVKEFGSASLQFQQAITNNENIKTIIIEFYATNRNGVESLVNTITLTNCKIVSINQNVNKARSSATLKDGLTEQIKFVYQKIEMKDATGFTTTDDIMNQN